MAIKKKLKTRLDLIQEAKDNAVYVVEDEKGNKVSNTRKSVSNKNIYTTGTQSRLQDNIAPIKTTTKSSSSRWKEGISPLPLAPSQGGSIVNLPNADPDAGRYLNLTVNRLDGKLLIKDTVTGRTFLQPKETEKNSLLDTTSVTDRILGVNTTPSTTTTDTRDLNSLSKKELLEKKKELLEQISNYDREEKRKWWDKDDNILENVGNVLYKAFLEDQDTMYVEDKTYDSLVKQLDDIEDLIEDKTLEETEYSDGVVGFIEKSGDTIVGNAYTGMKGIATTANKILGQEIKEEDYELHYLEKSAQKAREEASNGVERTILDVEGGVARMLPQMAVGNPTGATIVGFANYGGGAYNEARQEGYTDEQATKYGVAVGAMEMALTHALGSFGKVYGNTKLGSMSQSVIDKLIPKIIANKNVRHVLAQAGSEGIEEFIQEYTGEILKDTLLDEEGLLDSAWANITDPDLFADALYSGFVGAITGATLDIPSEISISNYEKTTGRDAETGYTRNEQKIIDSLVEEQSNSIAQQKSIEKTINEAIRTRETEQGGTLSAKEKTALTESIKAKIESGEIEVSNGKLTNKELSKIRQEVETKLKQGQLDTISIENILGKETDLSLDSYLQKSFQEQAKKSEAFTYDQTKVKNEQEKAVYDSAAKYFNDTTRSHEFVDRVAKISKDKGTNYGFINNEELKALGHDVEGKQVNGLVRVSKDGKQTVLINIDSNKALNTIVGHETTHLLEPSKEELKRAKELGIKTEYEQLQEAIFNYAKDRGDFNTRETSLKKLYEGIENADINSELTADLVGDYLFTDSKFIDSLSTQNPTVFQKIKDLIDDLVVRFTGTKEEQQLREVQKKFREAYRKNATTENVTSKETKTTKLNLTEQQLKIINGEVDVYHGTDADVTEMTSSKGKGMNFFSTNPKISKTYSKKGNVNSNRIKISNPLVIEGNGALYNQIEFQGGKYKTEQIANWARENGYDGVVFKNIVDQGGKNLSGIKQGESRVSDVFVTFDSNQSQVVEKGIKFSLNEAPKQDNQGRTLTKEQQEYFKDSKVRDGNGNLLTVYHGTGETFTKFEKEMIGSNFDQDVQGFFFTDDIEQAEDYANTTSYGMPRQNPGNVMETYLNITNPLIENIDFDPISHWDENYERLIQKANKNGNDGVIIKAQKYQSMYVAFEPNQIKNIDNTNPTNNEDIRRSLSNPNEQTAPIGDYNVYGEDIKLEQAIAPLQEEIKELTETVQELKEQIAPLQESPVKSEKSPVTVGQEVEYTQPTKAELDNIMALQEKGGTDYSNAFFEIRDKYGQRKLYKAIREYKKAPDTYEAPIKGDEYAPTPQNIVEQQRQDNFDNIDDANMPSEMEDVTPDVENEIAPTKSLFETRNYEELGNRKINAYQYDNPEVKPFFREEAQAMLGDLKATIKGKRQYNDQLYYESGGEQGYTGTQRLTTDDIAELLDGVDGKYKLTYADIEKGLNAIINDEGAENNAISKRIELYLDKRLREGYTTIDGIEIPANTRYLELMEGLDITDKHNSLPIADDMISGNVENSVENVSNSEVKAPIKKLEKSTTRITETSTPETITKGYQLTIDGKAEKVIDRSTYDKIAEVLTEEPKTESDRNKRKLAIFKANILDKGIVFEDLSLKEHNRELIAKWDYTLMSESRGQYAIGNGHNGLSKSLNDIRAEVDNTGNTKDFYNYMYHKHNVDRMTLDKRFGIENKPVFGESVTAEQSQAIVNEYEKTHPEFIDFAKDVYEYVNADKQLLVDNGIISIETADLWSEMYPHYVPTRRTTDTGLDINVPLDSRKTGINAPIKKATGGSSDILPLFDTMAMRTLQTYRATAKNSFGVELKNTLGTTVESNQINVDEIIDTIDSQEGLLQEGKKGNNPTFTVFENGEKVTFEITKDMYDALKPVSESSILSKTIKPLNVASNLRRGVLTEYNPTFMLTNAIKDVQDVLLNSQHAAKTYAKIPEAYMQIATKGYWYQEYVRNGGERNSYFDNETNTFKTENKGLKKVLDLPPLSTISKINNLIEMSPRLAEYIASRESGRSVEVSMLDAARVTTNFKAGGDVVKFANRNGATFLNASVQGAMQQVRNIREAKANGVRGWVNLATKYAIAGLPALILNNLVWEDDDEYEELSDYVKQNYYIVGKTDDGTFIRIPKGRAVAVIQDGLNQMQNLITGDDEADLKSFIDLTINNLAPNNPIDNNILSPIIQVANNEAWYGGDLVPKRLQNLPAAEQYDESTDMFSRWIGEIFNVSPYKVNYLIDQYSGGVGDVVLPMITPEATNDADTTGEYLIAPFKSKFTTNSTFNNQNVSDFYDTKEKLTIQANKSNATNKDVLKNKYMNSVNAELSELYEQKREIQNSDLPKSEKYRQAKEIQDQITEIAKNALSEYENVSEYSNYGAVGDREYYKKINSEGEVEWTKVDNEEAEDLNNLDMSKNDKNTYFKTKSEISQIVRDTDDSEDKKEQIIDSLLSSGMASKHKAYLYGKHYSSDKTLGKVMDSDIYFDDYLTFQKESLYMEDTETKVEHLYNSNMDSKTKEVLYETSVLSGFDNEDKYKDYKVAKATGVDIDSWLSYKKQEFVADKDSEGKSISGSRKDKVVSYINSLNLSIPQKAILIRQEYPSFDDYNNQIAQYVAGLDLAYEEKVSILEELDMQVDDEGYVHW